MFGKEIFNNKKILIYGLGISGNSCLKYLYKNNKVAVFDDNKNLQRRVTKKIFLNINNINKKKFDFIVISPGIDINKCKLKKYLL